MEDSNTPQLSLPEYRRYGRQMILDSFGLGGQLKLRQASVVVVGAGGLGCPALQYLAAAGIGTLGIVDHDNVDLSNLQRQILHAESRIGMNKALSAALALKQINSATEIVSHTCAITPANAVDLLRPYDIVLDCSDNAPTRYLLSDTCVALGRPLVSGAAQKFEGQLCTYNFGKDGPCYRCIFPTPPRPEFSGSCAELGVMGPVTGVVGNLQALEAIKIITGLADSQPTLLIYSALSPTPFRNIKLRSRRSSCPACGDEGQKAGTIAQVDYVAFCGGQRPNWEAQGLEEGPAGSRIKAKNFHDILQCQPHTCIIDVRPRVEFDICHLPGSLNIPLSELIANPQAQMHPENKEVYIVCRLGNDSQLAANAMRSVSGNFEVKDLIGGLRAWSVDVDSTFPIY